MIAEIYKEFDINISLANFFEIPDIRKLSKHIKEAHKGKTISIKPVEKREYYSLSPAQKRFYILNRMNPHDTIYQLPEVFIVEGEVDRRRAEKALKMLIANHETLRTFFFMKDNEPVQRIHDQVDFEIQVLAAAADKGSRNHEPHEIRKTYEAHEIPYIINNFLRPFNLSQAPLLRVGLFNLKEGKYLFLFDMHHIISDHISLELTVEGFIKLYVGNGKSEHEKLPGLKLQYKDYSEWQQELAVGGEMKRQEEYWLHEFSREIPLLDLPMDFQRSEVKQFEGDDVTFAISPQEIETLREYARQENATMFMVVLAVFYTFLFGLSGQEDIVIGIPTEGRKHPDLYQIIGIFINTLALRNYPETSKTFNQFLREVKQRTLDAFDNQDYQFEDLVKQVQVNRDSSRNPLFDVLYNFRTEDMRPSQKTEKGGEENSPALNLKMERYQSPHNKSMLDLVLIVIDIEKTGQIFFSMAYCTKLFKRETVEKFALCFKEIVSAVVENKHIPLREINISHDLEEAKSDIPTISFGF
jgi:hypothetical protein